MGTPFLSEIGVRILYLYFFGISCKLVGGGEVSGIVLDIGVGRWEVELDAFRMRWEKQNASLFTAVYQQLHIYTHDSNSSEMYGNYVFMQNSVYFFSLILTLECWYIICLWGYFMLFLTGIPGNEGEGCIKRPQTDSNQGHCGSWCNTKATALSHFAKF